MTEPQARSWAYAAAQGVLTVTGLPARRQRRGGRRRTGVHGVALAIGIRGARLSTPPCACVARTARLIAVTMLCSAVVTLTGFAIGIAAVVWTGLIVGCLAWLSIPLWVLATSRVLVPSRAVLPVLETAASPYRRET